MQPVMLSPQLLSLLQSITGEHYVFLDEETHRHYGHDETEDYNFPPSVVVKPGTTDEVSAIMKPPMVQLPWLLGSGG